VHALLHGHAGSPKDGSFDNDIVGPGMLRKQFQDTSRVLFHHSREWCYHVLKSKNDKAYAKIYFYE
jgi:hypothetical protein